MTRYAVAAGLFFAVVAVASGDDVEKALKELNGSYSLKSLSKGGQSPPEAAIKEFKGMTIKDGVMTLQIKDKEEAATLKIDPTKKPAHLDLSPTTGPEKGKTFPGLYRFEKGELTIVLVEDGERPKDLKADGKDVMTLVFTKNEK